MIILNHLMENFTTTDILFFTTYVLTAGLITGMSIKRIFFESNVAPPTPGSGTWQSTVQALPSPTVQPSSPVEHQLTQESLRYLQQILEENDPNNIGMQTISNKNDVGMQTEMDITDSVLLNQVNYSTAEAQTTEVLNVNTSNLNEMYLDQLDDFGVDITDLFTSNTENLLSSNLSTQTLFTSAETGMQTIDLNSEVGMQTIDLSSEVGMQTIANLYDKGTQIRPDLYIDLHNLPQPMLYPHGEILANGVVPPYVDLSMVEAYIPIPEIVNTVNDMMMYADLIIF